jgi:hypothetical protein
MSALERLVAEAEIARVLTTYARGVDRRDMDLVAGCYHPDATEDRGSFTGGVADFVAWLDAALGRMDGTWHLIGVPRITLDEDGDGADVETPCLGWHRLPATGDAPAAERTVPCSYVDRFERRDGTWLIASRTVVYEAYAGH